MSPSEKQYKLRDRALKIQSFDSEEQLVQAILSRAKGKHLRKYSVELEVDAGVGIADLVFTKRTPHSTTSLQALGNVSPRLAVLLSQEVGDSIRNRHALATNLGTSEEAAQRVIAKLAAAGIAKQSRNALRIRTVRRLPFEVIIAVEAKIRDWPRVLTQAYRNLQFADESWVVLDHAFARPALVHIERFKLAGVGLASINRAGFLYIHHEAVRQVPMSPGKRWQAQSVLASRLLARKISQSRT